MKAFYILGILFLLGVISSDNLSGLYSYRSRDYYERIEFKKDKIFIYNLRIGFSEDIVSGKYYISEDTLYLNSIPQKDRIIVFEDYKKNKKNSTFDVYNKDKNRLTYHLYINTTDNKVIELIDQWGKIKVDVDNVKSFYITDTRGLSSPTYNIIGRTNYFEILFETSRVFENESWLLNEGKIIPRSPNGDLRNHYLEYRGNGTD